MLREHWLALATKELRVEFQKVGETVPPVRVSTGFTGARRPDANAKVLGACWSANAAEDKVPQIFISPTVSDGLRVLDILTHELIHAIVPNAGHGPAFKRIAHKIGLTGPMRATTANDALKYILSGIVSRIGAYPHAKLDPGLSGVKKQTTRLIKVECRPCEYICRTTQSNLTRLGAPICPGCNTQMGVA